MTQFTSCPSGKKPYSTKAEARRAVHSLRKAGKPQRHYRCEHCGDYHLTSMRKGEYGRMLRDRGVA